MAVNGLDVTDGVSEPAKLLSESVLNDEDNVNADHISDMDFPDNNNDYSEIDANQTSRNDSPVITSYDVTNEAGPDNEPEVLPEVDPKETTEDTDGTRKTEEVKETVSDNEDTKSQSSSEGQGWQSDRLFTGPGMFYQRSTAAGVHIEKMTTVQKLRDQFESQKVIIMPKQPLDETVDSPTPVFV